MTCINNFQPSRSSTIIDIIPKTISPDQSSKTSLTEKTMTNISRRIDKRKYLHKRLCLVSSAMCAVGLFGIFLMIISNEITFAVGLDEDTMLNWFIKLTMSLSTILLLALIIYYHKLDLELYSIRNSVSSWRIGLTEKKLFLITLEIVVCIIHPIPRYFHPNWSLNSTTTTDSLPLSYLSFDVALGLPMFARLYLLCRFIMFHSSSMHNVSYQSLGYLNQVSMDFFFLIKTYLEQWPTRCLIIFCTMLFLIGSWSLRACNYLPTTEHEPMLDSMWLFIITFTTVGYGDFTPTTYCGRTVAAFIAFTGILSSALLISVLTQKLNLTRWEKYVHNFVSNIQLSKERKQQAANVIKFAVKVWYLKRKDKSKSLQCTRAEWKLFRSIRGIQEMKLEQRKLTDSCVVLADLLTLQRDANSEMEKVIQQMSTMQTTIDQIEKNFMDTKQTMNNIQYKLNVLLSRMQKEQESML